MKFSTKALQHHHAGIRKDHRKAVTALALTTGFALISSAPLQAVSLNLFDPEGSNFEEGTITHAHGTYNYHRWLNAGSHDGQSFDVIAIVTGGTDTQPIAASGGGPSMDVSPGFAKLSLAPSPLNEDGTTQNSVFTWVNLMFIESGANPSATDSWVQLPSVNLSWVDFDGIDVDIYGNGDGNVTATVAAEAVGMNLTNQMAYTTGNASGAGTSGVFGAGASGSEVYVGADVSTDLDPGDRPNTFESEGEIANWTYAMGENPGTGAYPYRNTPGNIPNQYLIDPLDLHPAHHPGFVTVNGTDVEGWRLRIRTATTDGSHRAIYFTGDVVIPEPSSALLSGLGILVAMFRRRRA